MVRFLIKSLCFDASGTSGWNCDLREGILHGKNHRMVLEACVSNGNV